MAVDRIHWRSKIKITIDWSKSSLPTESPLNNLGTTSYALTSVQSIDPQVNTNVDVNDSIETERNGYTIRPGRVIFIMSCLAAAPLTPEGQPKYSDSAIMSMIQYSRAIFDITISHSEGNDDFGQIVTLLDCIVNGGNPMQLTTDGRPLATFNFHALGVHGEFPGVAGGNVAAGGTGGSTYELVSG